MTIPPPPAVYDLAIIGAGAAGLAAAIFAAERAHERALRPRIVLIDGAKKPGAKILVSGGGRCNVTNAVVTEHHYFGGSPNIIRNVLRRFSNQDTIAWMRSLGVELKHEEPWGKMFPVTDTARTVLHALLGRVDELQIETRFGWRVADLHATHQTAPPPADAVPCWDIRAVTGETLTARRVIVATGGQALPKSGSDGAGYQWLRRIGHKIIPPVPALVPLVLDHAGAAGSPLSRHFADLSGVTVDATLHSSKAPGETAISRETGPILFTHFGLSGPTAMNISRHLARQRADAPDKDRVLTLSFPIPAEPGQLQKPGREAFDWLLIAGQKWPKASVASVLARIMPQRIAQVTAAEVENKPLGALTREERLSLANRLQNSRLAVKGDRGFTFAETTAGGVPLEEIQWRTMESRKARSLHLCGEVLDVDGRIGGFNFQWAWSSGYIAGRAAIDAGFPEKA